MKLQPMAAMIADLSGADLEAAYLAMMIHHHKGGEPMWAMAREKSKSETILSLEKETTPKEKKEVEQMTVWLKDWHGKTPQDFAEPPESKVMMEKDMAQLKEADDKNFDALFARKMARHHLGAIQMGRLAVKRGQHDEVKKFSEKLVESQTTDRAKLLEVAEKNE